MKRSANTNNDNNKGEIDSKQPAKKAARAQSPPKRVNKLFIREDVTITPEGTRTVNHDRNRIKSILKEGRMMKVSWSNVKSLLSMQLRRLLGRRVVVICEKIGSKKMPEVRDVDEYLESQGADVYILCSEYQALIATCSTKTCQELYEKGLEKVGLSDEPTKDAIDRIMKLANNDSMQKDEPAVYTANFGMTETTRLVNTKTCKSDRSKALDDSIGCHRGGDIRRMIETPNSPSSVIAKLYHENYLTSFDGDAKPEDSWYGKRENQKGRRLPRFSLNCPLCASEYVKLPFALVSSLPPENDPQLLAACDYENNLRTMAEWIIESCFPSLPYATTPYLAARQVAQACKLSRDHFKKTMPCEALARVFPKGAVGMKRTKELHDDGNAAIIPGIWTSVTGDESVALRFQSKQFNVYLRTTRRRFCWFYGWIPHKTEVLGDPSYRSLGKMEKVERIHHSAFWKPRSEHIALVLFQDEHFRTHVKSYRDIEDGLLW